jgi:hypothetical protein
MSGHFIDNNVVTYKIGTTDEEFLKYPGNSSSWPPPTDVTLNWYVSYYYFQHTTIKDEKADWTHDLSLKITENGPISM